MCYHKSITKSKWDIEKSTHKTFASEYDYKPMFHDNGFDHNPGPIITMDDPNLIQGFKWGLVPFFMKDWESAKALRNKTLNARSETVFTTNSYRNQIKNQRCLVLADGFYDYYTSPEKKKHPYYITLNTDSMIYFAGLYDRWQDPDTGNEYCSYTILTTDANAFMQKIHNINQRMPLILDSEARDLWLSSQASQLDLKSIMKPLPDGLLKGHEVNPLPKSTGNAEAIKQKIEDQLKLDF